jgi:hypothetical protein
MSTWTNSIEGESKATIAHRVATLTKASSSCVFILVVSRESLNMIIIDGFLWYKILSNERKPIKHYSSESGN